MRRKRKEIPRAFDEGLGFIYTQPWKEMDLSRCCSELIGEQVIAPRFNMEELPDTESIKHNPLYYFLEEYVTGTEKYSSGILIATVNPILEIKEGGLRREFPGSSRMNIICDAYNCGYLVYYPDFLTRA